MVTAVATKEKVEVRKITLEELGQMVGIPIKVRPWWGSVRRYSIEAILKFTLSPSGVEGEEEVGRKRRLTWLCPGGDTGSQKKRPEVQNGVIVLWQGQCGLKTSYRTRHGWSHTHAQQIQVKSVAHQAMLIGIRITEGAWSYFLLGMDGRSPYVVQVTRRSQTVEEALDWLMPNIVRKAIEQGLDVKRQGDWYFIPAKRNPQRHKNGSNVYGSSPGLKANVLYLGAALVFNGGQTRHWGSSVVYQTIQGVNGSAPIVKGKVEAPDHETLHLDSWHIGVRNRSHPWRNTRRDRRFDD